MWRAEYVFCAFLRLKVFPDIFVVLWEEEGGVVMLRVVNAPWVITHRAERLRMQLPSVCLNALCHALCSAVAGGGCHRGVRGCGGGWPIGGVRGTA
jgi:polysaccharide pyruvyl transferase WcaK-like protein